MDKDIGQYQKMKVLSFYKIIFGTVRKIILKKLAKSPQDSKWYRVVVTRRKVIGSN